jgi:superoxide reductase
MDKKNTRRDFLHQGALASLTVTASALGLIRFSPQTAHAEEPDLFKQINKAKDPGNLLGLEIGHVPIVHGPDSVRAGEAFEVEVHVGKKLHEMIPAHYVDWVDLYADDIFLTKIILTPNTTQPAFKVKLTLTASATLRAIEHCNLHGLWEGSKKINVS